MTGKQRAAGTKEFAATAQKDPWSAAAPRSLPVSASWHPVLKLQHTVGNQAVLRLLGSNAVLDEHIVQRKPVLKNCSGKEDAINAAIGDATRLAGLALRALRGEGVESGEREYLKAALRNNFGDVTDKQKDTIIDRYAKIVDTLDKKEITCVNLEKKENKKTICAEAAVNGNTISLFLHFWKDACGSKGEMLLHEAAHNAGAKDDIHADEGYPPKSKGEDNAYSYQHYALAVHQGPPRVKLDTPKRPVK